MGTLADVEPLEVHHNAGPATDDDAELDFLDDDLTDQLSYRTSST